MLTGTFIPGWAGSAREDAARRERRENAWKGWVAPVLPVSPPAIYPSAVRWTIATHTTVVGQSQRLNAPSPSGNLG
jgi:hypothetical protein